VQEARPLQKAPYGPPNLNTWYLKLAYAEFGNPNHILWRVAPVIVTTAKSAPASDYSVEWIGEAGSAPPTTSSPGS
jgi:hypothetical protein